MSKHCFGASFSRKRNETNADIPANIRVRAMLARVELLAEFSSGN